MDPDLFKHLNFRIGISQQMLQQITLGGAMIVLPLFLQMTLEYNAMQAGLSLAPLSLSMFGMAMLAGRKAGKWRPAQIVLAGFALSAIGMGAIIPLVPRVDSGWYLVIPLIVAGCGLGMLVSQLNNFTLAPISEDRVSEAAGVNSAAGSFGLSFGLAVAGGVMLWALALSFTHQTQASVVIPPAQQQQISAEMEHDAEVMSNTALQQQIADQPKAVQDEVLAINTHARNLSLQIALLIPALASLLGLANSFRMLRLPDITPRPTSTASDSDDRHRREGIGPRLHPPDRRSRAPIRQRRRRLGQRAATDRARSANFGSRSIRQTSSNSEVGPVQRRAATSSSRSGSRRSVANSRNSRASSRSSASRAAREAAPRNPSRTVRSQLLTFSGTASSVP